MTTGLLIRTLSLNDKPLTQPINGVFDESGGSIGRADANTMTLPDPERLISRMHARVLWDRNAFWIQDVGKGVGSLLNGRAIGTEAPVRLEAQDELRIGGYRLAVEILDQQTVVMLRQQTISQQRSMRLAEGPAILEGPAGSDRDPQPAHSSNDSAGDLPAPIDSPEAEQDSEPFRRPVPALVASPSGDPKRVPEAPNANASPITPTAAELWQAFLEGAGLPSNFPQQPTPQLMRILGTVVHEMTEGLLQLIAVRAAAKNQLRAAMTVIRARSNNPLKFSPDAGAALSYLLQPPASGFLDAPAAVQGAMHDMRSHLIGTMTGTRVALEGVLARFRPQLLEKQLASRGALDTVLPPIRRAKLWELYQEHFEALRGDAEDHFHQLFAEALVAACEKEIDRFERDGSRGARRTAA